MGIRLRGAALESAILDEAARLFAERGYSATAIQSVADGVGYSKAAILARYASKERLFSAVVDYCTSVAADILTAVDASGSDDRDLESITTFTDTALEHPGFAALILVAATSAQNELKSALTSVGDLIPQIFKTHPSSLESLERRVHITAALSVVASLVLVAADELPASAARPLIINAAMGALKGV